MEAAMAPKTALFAALPIAIAALVSLTAGAQARGGKEHFVQDYTFKQPMNGFSGRQGNYYCDFVKLPNRQCDVSGNNCRIVSWTLRQTCY
jgi:hypothetical protein